MAVTGAFTVKKATRVFKYNNLDLPDPNPTMTVKQVIDFYSNTYPELTNGYVDGEGLEGTNMVFKIKTSVGTKG